MIQMIKESLFFATIVIPNPREESRRVTPIQIIAHHSIILIILLRRTTEDTVVQDNYA